MMLLDSYFYNDQTVFILSEQLIEFKFARNTDVESKDFEDLFNGAI